MLALSQWVSENIGWPVAGWWLTGLVLVVSALAFWPVRGEAGR